MGKRVKDERRKGQPLAIDLTVASRSPDKPAFIARPEGALVYHGFRALDDVSVDGFTFGAITDFEAEPCDCGDAFVIAPDGSRAGLVWEVRPKPHFDELIPPEAGRWGVWAVAFQYPMTNRDDARKNLAAILPNLKKKWTEWKQTEQCTGK
jgi:hypothetical protein